VGSFDIEALVRRVPGWQNQRIDLAPLHGGITNTNYVATVAGQRAVVRVPGERTELLGIDRANEAEAAARAAALGIGPAVLGKLPEIGTLITALVPGRHLEPTPFTSRLAEVPRQRPAPGCVPDPSRRRVACPRRVVAWRRAAHLLRTVAPAEPTHRGSFRGGATADGALPQRSAARQRLVRRGR